MKDIDRALDFIARLAPRFPFLTDQEFCQIVFALIKQCPSLNKNTSTLGPRDVFPFTTCLRSSLNSGLHILRIRLWVGCDDFLRVRGIYCLGTVYIRNEQVEELGVHATQRPAQRIIRGGESECWQRERTPNALQGVGVRLTAAGLSIRETAAVLRLLGVNRSCGAVWQWIRRLADSLADPPTATPSQVAVDELAGRINGEVYWFYAATDTETEFLLVLS